MTMYGYARVSTVGQTLDAQIEQLKRAGCSKLFKEKISGMSSERPKLQLLLRKISQGDVVLVTRIDRFARSARDLLNMLTVIREQGATFRSLSEALDTSTPVGQLIITILGGIAEYEREIIMTRTAEGRSFARQAGVKFGRPSKLDDRQRRMAIRCRAAGESLAAIASKFNVSCSTVSRL